MYNSKDMFRFFYFLFVSVVFSSCITTEYYLRGFTCSPAVTKKKTSDIWISPFFGIDLYHHDNYLIQQYGNIADSVVLKSNHTVYIFFNDNYRQEQKKVIKITQNYLKSIQMKSTTKVVITGLGLYLEDYSETDDLIIVIDKVVTDPTQLLECLSDLIMETPYEALNLDNVKYECTYLAHPYKPTIQLFPIQTRKQNVIFSLPNQKGDKGVIRDHRVIEKKVTLADFHIQKKRR